MLPAAYKFPINAVKTKLYILITMLCQRSSPNHGETTLDRLGNSQTSSGPRLEVRASLDTASCIKVPSANVSMMTNDEYTAN